jgi:hypothetical protein
VLDELVDPRDGLSSPAVRNRQAKPLVGVVIALESIPRPIRDNYFCHVNV